MKERVISNISILINSFMFLILGIILISIPTTSIALFHLIVSVSIIVLACISTIFNAIRKKNIKDSLISLLMLIFGNYFLNNANTFLAIFPLFFGMYIFLCGIIKSVTFTVYKKRHFKGFYRLLFNAVLDLVLGTIIMFNPLKTLKTLTFVLGFYFIWVAFNYFLDFLEEYDVRSKKRRFRLTIPNIFTLFVPYIIYVKINKLLNREVTRVKIDKNTSGNVDLEIFIGVKESNIGKFGHADLCFNNTIYSYGHYDEDSKKLFDTIGDGVLFKVKNRKKYLRFCAEHSKKTIFAFGLTLSEKQKKRVQEELDKIESYTYRWKCVQEEDDSQEYGDYASCLYRATGAKFYKFKESNYRLYFVLWTNCVKLVDNVLGATGSDILRLNGFITPGTYYAYLNNEFKRKNSNVIKKEIITNKDVFDKENRPLI